MPIRALRQGSTFEQETTCTLMFLSEVSNAPRPDTRTFRSFPCNRGQNGYRIETSTPRSRACSPVEIPKSFSCQPEHTVRAMPRVVATKPHFDGDKLTLSLPREWNSSTVSWPNLYTTCRVVPSVYILRSSTNCDTASFGQRLWWSCKCTMQQGSGQVVCL